MYATENLFMTGPYVHSFTENIFMKRFIIRKIPVVIAIAAIGILLFSGVVMLLWNSILPAVLHISAITIWQAAGILLLSKMLFGGIRGRRFGGRRMWHCIPAGGRENAHRFACYHGHFENKGGSEAQKNEGV